MRRGFLHSRIGFFNFVGYFITFAIPRPYSVESFFFCGLFYNDLLIADYMASNGGINDEGWIEKDFEGCGRGLIVELSWHLPRGTIENYEKPQSG
jgi:hypothetical protein